MPGRHGIVRRLRKKPGNIVAHSDIAPARKHDPGELFPWNTLARFRLAWPRPTKNLMDPQWSDGGILLALERFGYDITESPAEVSAFKRRYRSAMIDCSTVGPRRSILLSFLLPNPRVDDCLSNDDRKYSMEKVSQEVGKS